MEIIYKKEQNRYLVVRNYKTLFSSYLRIDCEQYVWVHTFKKGDLMR